MRILMVLLGLAALSSPSHCASGPPAGRVTPLVLSDAQWRKRLPAFGYLVLRHGVTEPAFTGAYWNEHRAGTFLCAGCGLELFRSAQKFDSGTGWPSFVRPAAASHVTQIADSTLGTERVEVRCARCGGHLGHVFDDGPAPTGLRYCINSASLSFVPAH